MKVIEKIGYMDTSHVHEMLLKYAKDHNCSVEKAEQRILTAIRAEDTRNIREEG